ncbi:polysaccharide biosynthesis C-terminal domain-containing protein [Microbacterium sp. X-17]|uniref:lipopolysaccharide biosynthesis protein n=1 Tax=Microbacterium sp. X-17 TaxID=3144404 RepID=UPI0031F5B441
MSAVRHRDSVGIQAIALTVGSAVAQLIVAVLYVLAARSSDPSSYGVVVAAISVGMSAAGFYDFGSNSVWLRERAAARLGLTQFSSRARTKLLLIAVIGALLCLAGLVWSSTPVIVAVILFSVVVGQMMLVPLRADRQGVYVSIAFLVERVAAIALFGVLAMVGVGSLDALVPSLVFGSLLSALFAHIAAGPARFRFFRRGLGNPWSGAAYYGLSASANSAQQLDLALLGVVAGPSAAGVYGAVNRWTQPMGIIATAFSSAAVPFVAAAASWRDVLRISTRAVWLLGVAILGALLAAILAPVIVPLLLGDAYLGSVPLLQLLALGTIPAVLNQPLAAILQARNHDRGVAVIMLMAVALQLIGVAVLGSIAGAIGAAIAFCALQLILLLAFSGVLAAAYRRHSRVGAPA